MAIDIVKSKSGQSIKNGSIIVSTKVTGPTNKDLLNSYAINTPTIEEIENKYDNRFDDPSYYYGIGNSEILGV